MTPPKDKPTWGGKRPNQKGRPPIRKGAPRVNLHCMVDPATKAALATKSRLTAKSVGRVIDDLVAEDS